MEKANLWEKANKLAGKVIQPDRVVINQHGDAVHPDNTTKIFSVIFLRYDGWSVGCERDLWQITHKLYKDDWIAVIHNGDVIPYEKFISSVSYFFN